MSNYFKPSSYSIKNAILESARYDGVYIGDNLVMKDHGDYIEVNVDSENMKGHISFNVYYDNDGKITRIEKHK